VSLSTRAEPGDSTTTSNRESDSDSTFGFHQYIQSLGVAEADTLADAGDYLYGIHFLQDSPENRGASFNEPLLEPGTIEAAKIQDQVISTTPTTKNGDSKIELLKEAPEAHELRLKRERQKYAKRKAAETPEESEERSRKQSERYARSKMKETPEEKRERARKKNERNARYRAEELPKDRKIRLIKQKERDAKRLSAETTEERLIRLDRKRQNNAKRLSKESPDARKIRLRKMSEYKARMLEEKKTV
jgi:hypothetical protein